MSETRKQWLLKSRPTGAPTPENFELVESPAPAPGEGEILIRVIYMSLDPYMRGRMNAGKSYSARAELGEPMLGGGVGVIAASNNAAFKVGEYVMGATGWQSHLISNGAGLMKLDPASAPISTAVGILGMPGLTAYVGLLDIGQPKSGETVVVAAASGAVGSVVGQIARIRGARAVGIAGSPEKCAYVREELGFDECLNYKESDFRNRLAAACPDGIDVYFENVGGDVFDAVRPLFNDFARIPVCGRIANYNMSGDPEGPDKLPGFMGDVLVKRLTVQGFIVSDRYDRLPAFLKEMGDWIRSGKIKYREDIVAGIEKAPEAFIGLLKGKNFGKLLVQVSDDPTRK